VGENSKSRGTGGLAFFRDGAITFVAAAFRYWRSLRRYGRSGRLGRAFGVGGRKRSSSIELTSEVLASCRPATESVNACSDLRSVPFCLPCWRSFAVHGSKRRGLH